MDRPDWQHIRGIFEAALERPEGPLRTRYVTDTCAEDPELHAHVSQLLAHHDLEKGFLEPPATEQTDTDFLSPPTREGGTRVGGYLLERVIGVGGMGTIYQALQETPRRRVALKILTVGVLSPSGARRLHEEAEILARLHHPGIAQVYEAGVHVEGSGPWRREIPWFAMELVQGGVPITVHAEEQELGLRAKLALFTEVCDAVHHGHLHGVIHRDIKPANVLVDRAGRTKIIDFGVARVIGKDFTITTRLSGTAELAGTLAYMSPEQISGDSRDLDLRTDVYSLGVVLYELLCGRLPLDLGQHSLADSAALVRDEVPQRPGTIQPAVAGDLEWIVMRALEKERDRRYLSAHEFADDVRRFLDRRTVLARPPSVAYLLRVFARRNRALVAALGVLLSVFVVALIMVSSYALRAERDARRLASANQVLHQVLDAATSAESWGDGTQGWLIEHAADALTNEYAADPEVEATLRHVIGRGLTSLGQYERAVKELRRAEFLAAEARGPNDRETLIIRADLGVALAESGQLDEAELLLPALVEADPERGCGSPEWLWTLGRLARLRKLQGRSAEARELAALRLSISREWLGERHPLTLSARGDRAVLLAELGEREEAEAELRAALPTLAEEHGAAHSVAVDLRGELGALLVERGEYGEAEFLLRKNLDAMAMASGSIYAQTIAARQELGALLLRSGRPMEAEELLLDTLAIQRALFGEHHESVRVTVGGLARLYLDLGRREEAEEYYLEWIEQHRVLFGPHDERTLAEVSALALELLGWDRPADAEPLFVEALEGARGTHPGSPIEAACVANLDRCLAALEDTDE